MLDAQRALRNHPYRLRAAYELSQVYVRLKDQESARKAINKAIECLPQFDSGARKDDLRKSRWLCNIWIVQSRIERQVGNLRFGRTVSDPGNQARLWQRS